MATHILGIRHHGPGSARNVKAFLEAAKPDIILVEGPPEADVILKWATHTELKPPVAILWYQPDNPQQSAFYPFAAFSPEWQAIIYAKQHFIPVRFMDLPSGNQFAIEQEKRKLAEEAIAAPEKEAEKMLPDDESADEKIDNARMLSSDIKHKSAPMKLNQGIYSLAHRKICSNQTDEIAGEEIETSQSIRLDPISYLAQAAGYTDGEKWWEHFVEHRHNNEAIFEAVNEAMGVLRELLPAKDDRLEQLREAHMRKTMRQAEKEMFQNIAVVCGAWHAPALTNMPKQKEDNELLKNLPKVKVECTWIPWTYNRLSFSSGYGAGIASSYTESVFALEDASPNRIRFDLERVMRTEYRIDDFQESYFVIDSLDDLLQLATIDFGPLYDRIEGQAEHPPGKVLDSDTLISRGNSRYHTEKLRSA